MYVFFQGYFFHLFVNEIDGGGKLKENILHVSTLSLSLSLCLSLSASSEKFPSRQLNLPLPFLSPSSPSSPWQSQAAAGLFPVSIWAFSKLVSHLMLLLTEAFSLSL